jgi:hypothetical protein
MLVGALVPFHHTGGDPDTVREYAQVLEAAGSTFWRHQITYWAPT